MIDSAIVLISPRLAGLGLSTKVVAVCCSVLQCVAPRCSVLQCVAVCCSVLQCVAVCCTALHCVAVCCSALHCVAVCCSVLHCVALRCSRNQGTCTRPSCVMHCAAVHCTALHCTALCYSVLQCVAVRCSVLHCAAAGINNRRKNTDQGIKNREKKETLARTRIRKLRTERKQTHSRASEFSHICRLWEVSGKNKCNCAYVYIYIYNLLPHSEIVGDVGEKQMQL